MQFTVQTFDSIKHPSECLVLPMKKGAKLQAFAQSVDKATAGLVQKVIARGDFVGKQAEILLLHNNASADIFSRVLLLGMGDKELTEWDYQAVVRSLGNALLKLPVKTVAVAADGLDDKNRSMAWSLEILARQLVEADYQFNQFKSAKQPANQLQKIILAAPDNENIQALKKAVQLGKATGESVNIARELGDLPPNVCTPSYLAARARAMARKSPALNCKIFTEKEMQALGMGALLSVTAGTKEPAKLIVMNYQGAAKNKQPTVLVGKGVTFDSGGISIKPGTNMDEMKYDMCGAASVFGAMNAAVQLKLPINLVGIIPAVENMPSGTATRPGDIIKSMSGQTIEILNTDAEGRLILCDALTYAKRFNPKTVIDIATLTGACVMALGSHASGMFSNDEQLAQQLLSAGIDSGDRCWQMPLWPEYDKQLKSSFADMANIGGRFAGSITAACFLARFSKDYRWAHLDIAGSAWNSGNNKGATGRPVPLLINYLKQHG